MFEFREKYELGHLAKVLIELHLEQPEKFNEIFVVNRLKDKYEQLFSKE